MAIERVFLKPSSPKLFDRPIQDLQQTLAAKCLWIDHAFGRCERLAKEIDGRRLYTPNVYAGMDEYILLTPDNTELGNYCFFVREEPEQIAMNMGIQNRLKAPFSLVVWLDMRTFEDTDERDIYALEQQVLDAIGTPGAMRHGGMEVTRIYHKAENVFDGFSLDEVDNQFLMSPYYGIRVQMEILVDEECNVAESAPDPDPEPTPEPEPEPEPVPDDGGGDDNNDDNGNNNDDGND